MCLGLLLTVSVIYFTQHVGLPAPQFGAAMSAAGIVGLVAGLPAARTCAAIGSRRTLRAAQLIQAACFLALIQVQNLPAYILVTCVAVAAERADAAARGDITGTSLDPVTRVRTRAKIRSWGNVGAAVGGLLGALTLHLDTDGAYAAAFACMAALQVGCALVSGGLPDGAAGADDGVRHWAVLRDRPFVVLALANAVVCLHFGLFEVAMPLWIAEHTDAPTALVGILFAVNTLMVVLFQVRASRGADTPGPAARSVVRSGLFLASACVLFLVAGAKVGLIGSVALLVVATVAYVWGEMTQSAGGWGLSFGLSPQSRHAEYQALWGMSTAIGVILAPVFATAVVVGWTTFGWLVAAIVVMAGAAVTPAVTRLALAHVPELPRSATSEASETHAL